MNILLLSTHFNTGGISSYLLTLSRGLVKRGHRVIIATGGGNLVESLKPLGIEHLTLNIKTKSELDYRIYFALGPLTRVIRRHDIDIIHAQTRITQVMAACLRRISKRANLSTCHGFFKPRWSRKTFPCWGRAVIAISEAVRTHLINDFKIDPKCVALIRNGIDLDRFPLVTAEVKAQQRRQFGLKDDQPVIGMIARLCDVKGQDILISAMKKVVSVFPRAQLFIVGEGNGQGQLEKLVTSLNLKENVRFYSVVNETADMLVLFDIFVMPSRQEGLGLAVMEAQACGLPVVASNVGGLPSLIEDGRTGLLVPTENSNLLAEAILILLRHAPKAREMGQRAGEFIRKECSSEKMVEQTIQLYRRVSEESLKK